MSIPEPSDTELRRELWRHEYGYTSEPRIRGVLRAEYQRALGDFATVRAALPAVRRYDPDLLRKHDAFRARAAAAVNGGRHREALDALLHGRRLMEELRALAAAAMRLDQSAAAVERLHDRARTPGLQALPCVAAPARLLEMARARMAAKRYGQALYLAETALAEATPMDRRHHAEPGAQAALEARFAELRALCESTRELGGVAEPDPLADGSVNAALALARDGYAALAERMADELAFSLAPRRRFYREMQRASAVPQDATVLRHALSGAAGVPDADAWAGATAALWRSRVEAGLRRAEEQHRRLDWAGALVGLTRSFDNPSTGRTGDTR